MMKKLIDISCLCGALFALGACATPTNIEAMDALLTSPSPATTKALKQTIAAMLGQKNFALSKNAFVTTSKIFVERKMQADDQGNLLNGRVFNQDPVHIIKLQKRGNKCELWSKTNDKRIVLEDIECKAL